MHGIIAYAAHAIGGICGNAVDVSKLDVRRMKNYCLAISPRRLVAHDFRRLEIDDVLGNVRRKVAKAFKATRYGKGVEIVPGGNLMLSFIFITLLFLFSLCFFRCVAWTSVVWI